jgi:hypothetical protein
MAVNLTLSETLGGSAIADALSGGGTGLDFGSVQNGKYAPLVNQALNQGFQSLYIRHDAAIDPITDVKFFIDAYSTTGFTYGGAQSSAIDYTTMKSLGSASGTSKNNLDGLSGGLWIDMDAAQRLGANDTTRFDIASRPTNVKIFGDNGTDGQDLASAFLLQSESLVNAGHATPSAPVDGQIGKSLDTVRGDSALVLLRVYLPTAHPDGGIVQWAFAVVYSFTA